VDVRGRRCGKFVSKDDGSKEMEEKEEGGKAGAVAAPFRKMTPKTGLTSTGLAKLWDIT
jgi:hypothetical protein